jgi:hypothetical protein
VWQASNAADAAIVAASVVSVVLSGTVTDMPSLKSLRIFRIGRVVRGAWWYLAVLNVIKPAVTALRLDSVSLLSLIQLLTNPSALSRSYLTNIFARIRSFLARRNNCYSSQRRACSPTWAARISAAARLSSLPPCIRCAAGCCCCC